MLLKPAFLYVKLNGNISLIFYISKSLIPSPVEFEKEQMIKTQELMLW